MNIHMGNDEEAAQPKPQAQTQPQQDGSMGPAQRFVVSANMNTLDEPVCDTIKRDLLRIWEKLRVVINPFRSLQRASDDKSREIRNWDLWGPFIFCLALAVALSSSSNADQKTLIFELVFVIVWIGAAIISLNGSLLGGKISFFQSVCLLGYCLFPLNVAALLKFIIGSKVSIFINLIYVIAAFVWSTYSSIHFVKEMVPEDRKALAMYPVFLFYLFLSWFLVL